MNRNNNNRRYFEQAIAHNDGGWVNADGFDNFTDDMNFVGDSEALNAAGDGSMPQKRGAPTTQPYILQVANANAVATQFTLFNSYNNRTAANQGNPAGVTVTYSIAGISYVQLLGQLEHKNFQVGFIYMQVIAGSLGGVTIPLSLVTGDANGESNTKILSPVYDSYQQLNNVLEYYYTFNVNGFTNLTGLMPANTTVQYYFYPQSTVDTGRTLSNNAVVRDYAGPKIGKQQTTVLKVTPSVAAALATKGRGGNYSTGN